MVGEVTFAVIGLLFLIADVRTFSSTFQQTLYGQSNTTLAIMATAVFATCCRGFFPARAIASPRRRAPPTPAPSCSACISIS